MTIPLHLGIIIDGNRRWARERGLPAFEGHRQGYENVKKIADLCKQKGIKILTVYVFSTENWNRSKIEVGYLMKLLSRALNKNNVEKYHKKGFRLRILGQKERLSEDLQKETEKAEELTKNNNEMTLNLAISYGGRPEIIQAVRNIIKAKISDEKVDEELVSKNLWTAGMPDPDLIIRTGGEQRLSGFLTWQSVYSELYFTKIYWPAFTEKDLDEALLDYSQRQRRFGK